MSLLLKEKDYVADGNGGVTTVQDGDELISEVLFRLTARRWSFPFLPRLGSQMERLRREKPSAWDSLALQYAVEALSDLIGVTVTGAAVRQEGEKLWVTVELMWTGSPLSVTAQLEG